MNKRKEEETGVADIRRVRDAIAEQHGGDLAAHAAETNRIAQSLRKLHLGPISNPAEHHVARLPK